MLNIEEMSIQNIDHLGIVAGIVDAIGLVDIINDFLGKEDDEKVSAGHVVKAMILNGLGFVSQPLYMFPKFFDSLPCEHLIGEGVKAEYLNDDKLGRVMDKMFLKGLETIFLAISLNVVQKFKIQTTTSHLDSSSIHVHGEYNTSLPEVIFENSKIENELFQENSQLKSKQAINITYGYSRDHRPDLKQFLIELICTGDSDIPLFLKTASGNRVDSSYFGEIAVEYKKQMQLDSLIVADCALYTEANLQLMSQMKWLCRVPLSLKSAQSLVSTLPSEKFIESELKGYSFVATESDYGGIKQRWLVVQSQERREADLQKLSRKILKVEEKARRDLKKLATEKFACEADAVKALTKLSKQFKYHQIENYKVTEISSDSYQISATITKDENKINQDFLSAGRFIIATNVLDPNQLSNSTMIFHYKAQQSCERGFAFLKDPSFFANSVYLKRPERIEALAMIMGLCLLVYKLAQRQIRLALYESGLTVKNQLGKSVDNPTLKWIFQCFQSIHLVTYHSEKQVSNWSQERHFILNLLPNECQRYYRLVI
jgi:transposase